VLSPNTEDSPSTFAPFLCAQRLSLCKSREMRLVRFLVPSAKDMLTLLTGTLKSKLLFMLESNVGSLG
jgi:hypothetical protein